MQVDVPAERRRAARAHHHRQRRALRRRRQRPCAHSRPTIMSAASAGCARSRRNGGRRPGGSKATALDLRARRAVRQCLRRHPAGLRLRRRPDAAAVREGLCADACLLGLLSLAARGFRRRRGAAFRHPWRARIHAGQAGRPVRRVLAGPADRRPAEPLSLCGEQSVRRRDRQAPLGGDADQLSDAAGRACRALSAAFSISRPRSSAGAAWRRTTPPSARPRDADPGAGRARSISPRPSRPGTTTPQRDRRR